MRTLKFRGWHKKTKAMICPDYIDCDGDCFDFDKNTCSMKFDDDYILMQFTGLLDKNGKEIYEGDIIESSDTGFRYAVQWSEKIALFSAISNQLTMSAGSWKFHAVIGNIYENPELVEARNAH